MVHDRPFVRRHVIVACGAMAVSEPGEIAAITRADKRWLKSYGIRSEAINF
jgi:hypothetical protein